MDDPNTTAFIDHKETIVSVPQPRQMNASKRDITPTEENESSFCGEIEASAHAAENESRVDSEMKVSTLMSAHEPLFAEEAQISSAAPILPSTSTDILAMPESVDLSEAQLPAQEDVVQSRADSKVESSSTSADVYSPFPKENQKKAVDQERVAEENSSGGELFLSEVANVGRSEEEKEVSEYCPGLAIRSLALEDILEKRTDPSSELGTSQMMSQSAASSLYCESSSSAPSNGQNALQHGDRSAAPPKKPFFDPIEVERKFTIAADTEERLKSLGAKLHKEKTFSDVYYDNDEYSLILSDCWLRRRNNTWEAKVPFRPQNSHALFAPATQYREITDEREMSTWLVDHLKLERWMRGDPIELLVQAAGLTAFAKFTTVRRTYNLPSCVVDLDLTDHGFRVGEIEVMAGSPEEVPHALQIIADMAQQLGLTPLILA